MGTGRPLVLSLFPGIGLLDRAFEEEGFTVVRGPDVLWGGDVRAFHPPAGVFDGVIGGPPCQLFSGLGNLSRARGTVHEDLIPEFERCVEEAAPPWFLMENVEQAPVPQVRHYWPAYAAVLNLRWLGEPQNRKRRFSFATRQDVTPRGVVLDVSVDIVPLECQEWAHAVTAAHGGERKTHTNRRLGGRIKRYATAQAAVLQGLSADFLENAPFTKQGRLKAIANGVPLPMGRAVARAIRRAMYADSPRQGSAEGAKHRTESPVREAQAPKEAE